MLSGQAGADELQGEGGADRYVFTQGGGADEVRGFEDGADILDLRFYAGATFANTTIAQQGADTQVTFVGGESVLLVSVGAANVSAADFLFGP